MMLRAISVSEEPYRYAILVLDLHILKILIVFFMITIHDNDHSNVLFSYLVEMYQKDCFTNYTIYKLLHSFL